jgi:hypothetical protein
MKNPLRLLALSLSLLMVGGAYAQDDTKKKAKPGFSKTASKAMDDDDDDDLPAKSPRAASRDADEKAEKAMKRGNLPPTTKAGKVYLRPAFNNLVTELDAKQKAAYEKAYLAGKAKIAIVQEQLEKAKDDLDDALEAILTPAQLKEHKAYEKKQDDARKERAAKKKMEKANKKAGANSK